MAENEKTSPPEPAAPAPDADSQPAPAVSPSDSPFRVPAGEPVGRDNDSPSTKR